MSYSEFDSFDNSIEKMLDNEMRRYSSPFSYFDCIDANNPEKSVNDAKQEPKEAKKLRLESKHNWNDRWLKIGEPGVGFIPSDERVNSPSHYTRGKVEAIDIIEDAIQDAPTPGKGMLQAQVLKYILRLWLKDNPVEDAKKARWYLDRLIDKLS